VQLSETDLEEVSDVILQYKVASIVFHQAIETITGVITTKDCALEVVVL
jgi:hypothetical protein